MKNVSFTERLVHAVGYEVFAVLLCAPLLSWIMGKSLATAGALAVPLSVIAMLWNMLFNYLFDRAQSRLGFERGLWARISHALLFEAGLILVLVPLAAWLLPAAGSGAGTTQRQVQYASTAARQARARVLSSDTLVVCSRADLSNETARMTGHRYAVRVLPHKLGSNAACVCALANRAGSFACRQCFLPHSVRAHGANPA